MGEKKVIQSYCGEKREMGNIELLFFVNILRYAFYPLICSSVVDQFHFDPDPDP